MKLHPEIASLLYMLGSVILFIVAPNAAFAIASALFFAGSVVSLFGVIHGKS